MNAQELVVWFDGGCTTIGAPELSFQDNIVLDENSIDYSDPDTGIFWQRCFTLLNEPNKKFDNSLDDLEEEVEEEQFDDLDEDGKPVNALRVLQRRTCVVAYDDLCRATEVVVRGRTVLVRDPRATNKCGLIESELLDKADQDEEEGFVAYQE